LPQIEKMSLKSFWEAVEQRLATYSTDELRAILRAMAQGTPPTERQAFLARLKPMPETAAAVQQALRQEDLLADIADLTQELKAEMEQAEYWEERHGWDRYYDDEDSLGPYEDLVEPLIALFDRTDAVFDYGNYALAHAAYQKLFVVLGLEDDYGRGVGAGDLQSVDIGEARARYLRAVYETEPPVHRPQALFEQMRQMQSRIARPRPMLEDIIEISPKPLPDQSQFLSDWIAFLREQSGSDADGWLREAVRLSQGTQGLEELARAEGKKRPRAYLDWFAALEQDGRHRQVLAAAQEALQTLPNKLPIRAAIADHLCTAAAKLNATDTLCAGRWEAFVAKPTLVRLLDLWDTAPTGEDRTRLMQKAVQHVKDYLAHPSGRQEIGTWWSEDGLEQPAWINKSVLAHAYLLAEDWDPARQMAAREKVLGWSSSDNPQGLVVSFFLVLLSDERPGTLPLNLTQLWQWGLQNSISFGYWGGLSKEEDRTLRRLEHVYADRLSTTSLSHGKQEQVLSWCLDVAQQRVNAIVSNQHRGSYGKAAVLIAACAEVLRLRGKGKEAGTLLDDVRSRFPRHRAFQAELKAAVQRMERSLKE
jgi:tetratricopeptide (TPR) repeat protein